MDPHTRQRRQAPESDSDTYSNEGCEVEDERPSAPRHQFQMQDSSSSRNITSGGEERDLAVEEEEEKETHGGHRRRKQQRSDFVPASVALTHTTRQRVDFPKADSRCLEALLRHYPWIVYFVFSAWRKMLILCHIDQNGDDGNLPLIAQLALVGDLPNGIESALPRALYLHRERYSPIKYSALSIGFGLFFDICRRNNQNDCLAWLHKELPIERDWDTWAFDPTAVVPELTALTSSLLVQQLALETDRDDRARVAKQLCILLADRFGRVLRQQTRTERHQSIHADAADVARLFHLEKEPAVSLYYSMFFCEFGNVQGVSSFFTRHPEVISQLLRLYLAEPLNQGDSFLKCSAWAGMALCGIIESYKNDNNLQDLFFGAPSSSSSPSPESFPIHQIIEQCLDRLKTGVADLVAPSLRLLITFFSMPYPGGAEGNDASPKTPTQATLGDQILDSVGPFPEISDLLQNGINYIVDSTCELLSVIADGSDRHRQWLVESGHLPLCVRMLDAANGVPAKPNVNKQLVTLFSRVADNASTDQLDYLIETCQFLPPFVAALPVADPKFVLMILSSLKKMLQRSSEPKVAALLTGEANAIPVLKDLRGIAEASEILRMLDAGEDEEGDDESMFFAVE